MIIEVECSYCHGVGLQHSPGRNGDPMDNGVPCHMCNGSGVEEYEPEDEIEDWME